MVEFHSCVATSISNYKGGYVRNLALREASESVIVVKSTKNH